MVFSSLCGLCRLQRSVSSGYGYAAIIGAYLGGLNPLEIIVSAFLMSVIYIGGDNAMVAPDLPVAAVRVFAACLFGARSLGGLSAQASGIGLPSQLLASVPYLVTILLLVVNSSNRCRMRLNSAAALGQPFERWAVEPTSP